MQVSWLKLFNPKHRRESLIAAAHICETLALSPEVFEGASAGLLDKFAGPIRHYHQDLRLNFEEFASTAAEPAWKADQLRSSIQRREDDINAMREPI